MDERPCGLLLYWIMVASTSLSTQVPQTKCGAGSVTSPHVSHHPNVTAAVYTSFLSRSFVSAMFASARASPPPPFPKPATGFLMGSTSSRSAFPHVPHIVAVYRMVRSGLTL